MTEQQEQDVANDYPVVELRRAIMRYCDLTEPDAEQITTAESAKELLEGWLAKYGDKM